MTRSAVRSRLAPPSTFLREPLQISVELYGEVSGGETARRIAKLFFRPVMLSLVVYPIIRKIPKFCASAVFTKYESAVPFEAPNFRMRGRVIV